MDFVRPTIVMEPLSKNQSSRFPLEWVKFSGATIIFKTKEKNYSFQANKGKWDKRNGFSLEGQDFDLHCLPQHSNEFKGLLKYKSHPLASLHIKYDGAGMNLYAYGSVPKSVKIPYCHFNFHKPFFLSAQLYAHQKLRLTGQIEDLILYVKGSLDACDYRVTYGKATLKGAMNTSRYTLESHHTDLFTQWLPLSFPSLNHLKIQGEWQKSLTLETDQGMIESKWTKGNLSECTASFKDFLTPYGPLTLDLDLKKNQNLSGHVKGCLKDLNFHSVWKEGNNTTQMKDKSAQAYVTWTEDGKGYCLVKSPYLNILCHPSFQKGQWSSPDIKISGPKWHMKASYQNHNLQGMMKGDSFDCDTLQDPSSYILQLCQNAWQKISLDMKGKIDIDLKSLKVNHHDIQNVKTQLTLLPRNIKVDTFVGEIYGGKIRASGMYENKVYTAKIHGQNIGHPGLKNILNKGSLKDFVFEGQWKKWPKDLKGSLKAYVHNVACINSEFPSVVIPELTLQGIIKHGIFRGQTGAIKEPNLQGKMRGRFSFENYFIDMLFRGKIHNKDVNLKIYGPPHNIIVKKEK